MSEKHSIDDLDQDELKARLEGYEVELRMRCIEHVLKFCSPCHNFEEVTKNADVLFQYVFWGS